MRPLDHPTKPIGPFLSVKQAASLSRQRGRQVIEDSGRGHRRVVPPPIPVEIVEMQAIRTLLDAGHVVLAAGGGGIADERPVHVLSADKAEQHLAQGQFPAGSMGPKVAAALAFLRDGGQRVFSTSGDRLVAAACGDDGVGTRIEPAHAAVASAT